MRILCVLMCLVAVGAAAADLPLVVAVDTSRSLRSADLSAIHGLLAEGFADLPDEVPVGLIAFDDRARWLSLPGSDRAQILDDLTVVEPAGSYTVLYDALYLAAQEMESGGVVLVMSDGRDENSAVRIQDIEGLCARNGVRVLTLGVGGRVDERALRRLGLLTRGRYLGRVGAVDGSAMASAFVEVRPEPEGPVTGAAGSPSAAGGAATAPGSSRSETPPSEAAEDQPQDTGTGVWMLVAAPIAASLLAAGIIGWWLLRKNEERLCEVCGATLPEGVEDCEICRAAALREASRAEFHAASSPVKVEDFESEGLALETVPGILDKTMVLGEMGVLAVREEGQAERLYTLPRIRGFAVGRAPHINTIQVEDPTISAQHFKIVYKEDGYYVIDMGTTNGTTVNDERVRVHRLLPGDVIRAGLTEFEFAFHGAVAPQEEPEEPSLAHRTAPPPINDD